MAVLCGLTDSTSYTGPSLGDLALFDVCTSVPFPKECQDTDTNHGINAGLLSLGLDLASSYPKIAAHVVAVRAHPTLTTYCDRRGF
jgi:hypothetical protein